ncbi:MAG: DEAD/DEAH box helicase [Alphaproteobacteria bacterium]|nr:DEAD/DEAH box helicase [Alphaproteobacteria bacterium]
MTFSDLGLSAEVLRAVADAGYETPTPIQQKAIPYVLMGRDVLGCAQTGTGKTAGFTLPMIDILAQGRARARMPRSLILEPTRELAAQVAENFDIYGKYNKLTQALLIGGVSYDDQEKLLDRGVDVLIATPGRLLDHFERGRILLNDVNILVIDEADRMLDMGFIPDVERIVSLLPKKRQTLFFSATMPPEIRRLADAFLSEPKEISVSAPASAAVTVTQGLALVPGSDYAKREALRALIRAETVKNALIFCNRKRDVDTLYKSLKRHGFSVGSLHGDMDQSTRMETLDAFKRGDMTLLVCSDVAARGLDIDDLSHVFNFDVPIHAEDYVHRIGRTGRAGRSGRAFTLATSDDRKFVDAIERLIGKQIPRITIEGVAAPVPGTEEAPRERSGRGRGRRGGSRKSGGERHPRQHREHHEHQEQPAAAAHAPARPARAPQGPAPLPHHPFDDARKGTAPAHEHAARPAQAARSHDHKAHDQRPHEPRAQDHRRHREEHDDGPAQKGLGDHMPAFLTRGKRAIG